MLLKMRQMREITGFPEKSVEQLTPKGSLYHLSTLVIVILLLLSREIDEQTWLQHFSTPHPNPTNGINSCCYYDSFHNQQAFIENSFES